MPNEARVPVSDIQAGMRYRLHAEAGQVIEGTIMQIDHRDRLIIKLDQQYLVPYQGFCLWLPRSNIRHAEKLW